MIEGRDWIGWLSFAEESGYVSFNTTKPEILNARGGWKTKKVRIRIPDSFFEPAEQCEIQVVQTEDEK